MSHAPPRAALNRGGVGLVESAAGARSSTPPYPGHRPARPPHRARVRWRCGGHRPVATEWRRGGSMGAAEATGRRGVSSPPMLLKEEDGVGAATAQLGRQAGSCLGRVRAGAWHRPSGPAAHGPSAGVRSFSFFLIKTKALKLFW